MPVPVFRTAERGVVLQVGVQAHRGSLERSASPNPSREWSRCSGRGAHQFHRPRSAMRDGTSKARTKKASKRTAAAVPTPTSFKNTRWEVAKAPMATASNNEALVTNLPVLCMPTATASCCATRAGLFRPCEQEHAVVGREGEGQRRQHEEICLFDAALADIAEKASEAPVLENEHQDPCRRRRGEAVHQQRFERQYQRACHRPQDQ